MSLFSSKSGFLSLCVYKPPSDDIDPYKETVVERAADFHGEVTLLLILR